MEMLVEMALSFRVKGKWSKEKTRKVKAYIKDILGDKFAGNVGESVSMTVLPTAVLGPEKKSEPKPLKFENTIKEEPEKPVEKKSEDDTAKIETEDDKRLMNRIVACVERVYQASIKNDIDQYLRNDLGLDSLDAIELVMSLEDEFEIEIYDNEAESYYDKRVKDILTLIKAKLKEKEEKHGA